MRREMIANDQGDAYRKFWNAKGRLYATETQTSKVDSRRSLRQTPAFDIWSARFLFASKVSNRTNSTSKAVRRARPQKFWLGSAGWQLTCKEMRLGAQILRIRAFCLGMSLNTCRAMPIFQPQAGQEPPSIGRVERLASLGVDHEDERGLAAASA
jgi:hypothetical protein